MVFKSKNISQVDLFYVLLSFHKLKVTRHFYRSSYLFIYFLIEDKTNLLVFWLHVSCHLLTRATEIEKKVRIKGK